jgi:Domain of unknown function (DUF1931)
MPAIGVATFERFFREAASLDVDKTDIDRYEEFVRDKIADLLIVAEANASADDRDVLELRDLPITKGLQETIHQFRRFDESGEFGRMLAQITVRPQLDRVVSDEVDEALPEVAGALSLALGRTFPIIDPDVRNPQSEQWERALRIFDLLL